MLRTYNTKIQIKFKTSVLGSGFCEYGDIYIHVKGSKIIPNTGAATAQNHVGKNILKLCSIYWLHKRNKQCTSR